MIKNTKHWKLQMIIHWVEKPIEQKKCTACGGTGLKYGTGFNNLYAEEDPDESCDTCYGRRTVDVEKREPQPSVDKDLHEHMQRAWCEFLGIWKLPKKRR